MYQHILVPVDDSELAIITVGKAVSFARTLGARITFFHARSDFAATSDGAVIHALSPTEFVEQAAGNARAVLARAESEARLAGVPFASVGRTSDRPYEAILDIATEQGCDLIFMASHGRRGLKGLLLGSQTQKVLAHTTIPVLVSSVESNALTPDMDSALAVIKGEHRSMAAVMHGLKHVLLEARSAGSAADVRLLRSMVYYFRNFTEGLHHPKEDAYLFDKLAGRSHDADEVLATLRAQHHEEGAYIEAVDKAVNAYAGSPDGAHLDALIEAVDRYAGRLWEHMNLEEKFILPACQTHLTGPDWAAVAHAFEANGDPRFDADKAQGFDKLFLRLVTLAD
ncbi:MAG: universal stress protein [Zoogloea oleivorans]|jgi:nucleotide-binding universal stress UspA family protein/hemerythrin-like domain-containing protein|uniref:universal stress protein n=1 Tax=Zoogloea oleivorans TaxID=1552750 RepID=UPI002A36A5AB|nr:universal stress protein [Zoogloea oleivorans]MDY0036295.1 universal stress protein [Zoogloea oleivorans]